MHWRIRPRVLIFDSYMRFMELSVHKGKIIKYSTALLDTDALSPSESCSLLPFPSFRHPIQSQD